MNCAAPQTHSVSQHCLTEGAGNKKQELADGKLSALWFYIQSLLPSNQSYKVRRFKKLDRITLCEPVNPKKMQVQSQVKYTFKSLTLIVLSDFNDKSLFHVSRLKYFSLLMFF